jgi:hypothetical protein
MKKVVAGVALAVVGFTAGLSVNKAPVVTPAPIADKTGIVTKEVVKAPPIKVTDPNYGLPKIKRKIEAVVIHHTAGNEKSVNQIRIGHKKRGFSDIAYHYVIFPNGKIETGRNLNIKDGGVYSASSKHQWVAIVMIGKLHLHRPTQAQWIATTQLAAKWTLKEKLPYTRVYGHKEVAIKNHGTLCPGFKDMKKFRLQVIEEQRVLTTRIK